MEIIPRQRAITEKLIRYFTGVPCRNGHVAERYTRCAVCVECLHPSFENKEAIERKAARVATLSERQAAIAQKMDFRRRALSAQLQMTRIKIVLHTDDYQYFAAIAHAFALTREPSLQPEDILTRFAPRHRGTSTYLHAFKAFPEDAPALYKLQEDLTFARLSPEQQAAVTAAAGRRIA